MSFLSGWPVPSGAGFWALPCVWTKQQASKQLLFFFVPSYLRFFSIAVFAFFFSLIFLKFYFFWSAPLAKHGKHGTEYDRSRPKLICRQASQVAKR